MIEIKDKKECCGCHACFNICPTQAITMVEDEKGFKYPKVDTTKCINCGLCEKVCPILNKVKAENEPIAYAVKNKDEEIRRQSSSGGIFTLLAESIIKNNGVVFGAVFDDNFRVKHICVDNIKDLNKMRGSKYMQSTIGDTYKKVKEYLDNDKKVLFTGTPCQIEGLKSYLRKDYKNLYTQDIVCHGVPSPKVHDKYLEYQRNNYKEESIEEVIHRTKIHGWEKWDVCIKFKGNKFLENHNKDLFMQAFLKNTTLRDSCYACNFKKENRISDITLADFWGIDNIAPEMNDDKGTSLVIINSDKGQEMFENIKEKIIYKKVDFEQAIKYNQSMITSVSMDKNREKFFENLDKLPFDQLVKKYTYHPSIVRRIMSKVKRIIKKLLKL